MRRDPSMPTPPSRRTRGRGLAAGARRRFVGFRSRGALGLVAILALGGVTAGPLPARAAPSQAPPSTVAPSSSPTPPGSTPTSTEPAEDLTPIPLARAAVPITDDPRVAPELAAVGLTGDDYAKAVKAYDDTDRQRHAAIDAGADATRRFDRAVADLKQLSVVIPRVEGEQHVALRREAKAATLLDEARAKLGTVVVDAYVTGGLGSTPQDDLLPTAANDARSKRVLMQVVQRHNLHDVAWYTDVEQDEAAHIDRATAQLDDLQRRVTETQAARDQAAADRDRAAADEQRLDLELVARRKGIADARLTSDIDGLDFSFVVLNAYVHAADVVALEKPSCGIRWNTLAAVGRTESRHGTYAGGEVDADGLVTKPIFGISLDGSNGTAVVADTDQGEIDGDPNSDRAAGPMQFIPGTWKRWARDGNGDGKADIQNMYDAALTAAVYLCQKGPGLDADPGLRRAIFSYNADQGYVSIVLARAHHYGRFQFPAVH